MSTKAVKPFKRVFLIELPCSIINAHHYYRSITAVFYSFDCVIDLIIEAYANEKIHAIDADEWISNTIEYENSSDYVPDNDLTPVDDDIQCTIINEISDMYRMAFDRIDLEFSMLERISNMGISDINIDVDKKITVILTLE